MPLPTARSAVPMAAVVLPLPGPVFTMMRPRLTSGMSSQLVARVVRVALEDCKSPVELLEQDDAGEFVGQGHLAEGEHQVSGVTRFIAEPVGRADGKDQGLGAAVLLVA